MHITNLQSNWKASSFLDLKKFFFFLKRAPEVTLVAQLVKNLPAVQETLVWFLGYKDPLEKG